ncbi:MAG TPA: PfkB family carbohydrate kinase [Gemmataceae bacterium]|jgi:rfaE bifunctional protein kinase chain/domain
MNPERFAEITGAYPRLRIAVLGDFCLDRYLEIDPGKQETSLETGLAVHNVVQVRAQPGAAGTIVNNLSALGVGEIVPIGFAGEDGEGHELRCALQQRPGVRLDHFVCTPLRQTFTYGKPLLMEAGRPPRELNRLDIKNWSPTPPLVENELLRSLKAVAERIDALIVMDQVDVAETGVATSRVVEGLSDLVARKPKLLVLADSRRGLRGFPPVCLKMNRAELGRLTELPPQADFQEVGRAAAALARRGGQPVFVTLAEQGLLGATPQGSVDHLPAFPLRGDIDIVGAGDAVSANLTAALAAGASMREALELAGTAASVVIHQLGTSGTASVAQLQELLHRVQL